MNNYRKLVRNLREKKKEKLDIKKNVNNITKDKKSKKN